MATRLVADELDLNLATLAAALVVIVVLFISRRGALSLDAARVGCAIADGVVVEVSR